MSIPSTILINSTEQICVEMLNKRSKVLAMVDFNTLDKIEERGPEDSEAEGSSPEGSGPDYYGTDDFGTGRSGKIFKKRASVKQKN